MQRIFKLEFIVLFDCCERLTNTVSLRGGATPRRGNLPVQSNNYNCTQNRSMTQNVPYFEHFRRPALYQEIATALRASQWQWCFLPDCADLNSTINWIFQKRLDLLPAALFSARHDIWQQHLVKPDETAENAPNWLIFCGFSSIMGVRKIESE